VIVGPTSASHASPVANQIAVITDVSAATTAAHVFLDSFGNHTHRRRREPLGRNRARLDRAGSALRTQWIRTNSPAPIVALASNLTTS